MISLLRSAYRRPCVDIEGLRSPVDLWLAGGGKFHTIRRRQIPPPEEVLPRWADGGELPAGWVFPSPARSDIPLSNLGHLYADITEAGGAKFWYPPTPRESEYAQPDWDDVLRELRAKRKRRRVRATRRTLWDEYRDETRAQGGKAYSYSQFCARLKAHQGSCGGSAQRHFDYEPGLYGMADLSGKTLALCTGRGETDVEIFVAVLAHSNLIYAEAVPDQTVRHWTMAHRRALEYFGGTPRRWIIDNLKSGVDDPERDDIRLNPSFREFALHYGIAVLPARKYRATDKGLVESCVKAVQTRILLALRHQTFFSLDTMNAAIRRELDRLNDTPMAKCGESRRGLFEANERTALAAQPAHAWEWGEWVERKVGSTCHVRFDKNHYSAPERHMGRQVDVRVSERMVEVFLRRDRFLGVTAGVVAHPDHPLHAGRVRPGDLAGFPWIDLDGPVAGGGRPSLAAVLDELRARTGRHVRAVVRAGSAGLLLAGGPWLGWLPLNLLDRLPGAPLKALPLTFGRRRYRTGFVARRSAEDLAPFRHLEAAVRDAALHPGRRTRG